MLRCPFFRRYRECLWFWRVTLAAPEMALRDRILIMVQLVADEISGRLSPEGLRGIETQLADEQLGAGREMKFTELPGIWVMGMFSKLLLEVGGETHGRQRPAKRR